MARAPRLCSKRLRKPSWLNMNEKHSGRSDAMAMRRAPNRGAALNSEKENTYFLACDVDSNNYSFLNSTCIVSRRSILVFRRRRVRAHTVNHQTRKLVLLRCVSRVREYIDEDTY
mmetsp:Transcript_1720/g.6284  ORF Transcript_1720/g.6284 Transcript_1720/m.6284 type:complete len:115 (-) Transcript_1720:899-1243(-)